MNLTPGQKSGKKRTKLERLLRQDHSDVYFDNEKLNDALNNHIEFMQREMHKHDIQRGIEIGKLRKEISESKTCRNQSSTEKQLLRPQTADSGNHNKRLKAGSPVKRRAKTALVRSESKPIEENADLTLSPERSLSPASTVSTLKNTKTLQRYQHIGPHSFKENNRYPAEWYVKSIPASDAAIYNARKKVRGKSAPPHFDFLAKIRDKEETEKKLLAYTNTKFTKPSSQNDNMTDGSGLERMSLICEEQVKPVLMSLRRLKEMSNADNTVDRGPSRNTEVRLRIKEQYKLEKKRLDDKVTDFCKNIEELKTREARALKEREETRRKAAQEQLYLESINLAQLEESEEQSKDSDSDDGRWGSKWR